MKDEELGRYLLEGKAITAEALQRARGEAKRRGCTLEALLRETGLVKEHDLLVAIGKMLRIPYMDLDDMVVDRETARLIPEHLAHRSRVLPVKIAEGELLLAMADPCNVIALDDIQLITGYRVRPAVAAESAIKRYLQWAYDDQASSPALSGHEPAAPPGGPASREELLELADEAPIVRVTNLVISQAMNDRASEIILQPTDREVTVFYIIDDQLHEVMNIPLHVREAVTARIKIMATTDPFTTTAPQSGRIHLSHDGKRMTITVTTEPGEWGEKVTLVFG